MEFMIHIKPFHNSTLPRWMVCFTIMHYSPRHKTERMKSERLDSDNDSEEILEEAQPKNRLMLGEFHLYHHHIEVKDQETLPDDNRQRGFAQQPFLVETYRGEIPVFSSPWMVGKDEKTGDVVCPTIPFPPESPDSNTTRKESDHFSDSDKEMDEKNDQRILSLLNSYESKGTYTREYDIDRKRSPRRENSKK